MANLNLVASLKPLAPEQVGQTYITVVVGQTKNITQSELMGSSLPPYFQEEQMPMGEIKIVGYGTNPNNLLRPTGTAVIATLTNNTAVIRYNEVTNVWTNNIISTSNFIANKFSVKGNSIGMDYIDFVCKAYNDGVNPMLESDYSNDTGRIWIKVISATNSPPSNVGNNNVVFVIGTPRILTSDLFTTLTTPPYSDPENDPPKSIKVLALPSTGLLLFNGVAVVVGQIISVEDLDLGKLKYHDFEEAVLGQIIPFEFEVCDTGTGIFVG